MYSNYNTRHVGITPQSDERIAWWTVESPSLSFCAQFMPFVRDMSFSPNTTRMPHRSADSLAGVVELRKLS
jgi:hypothetical protein